jgi:MFS family permease
LPFAVYFLSIPIAFVALTTIPETRREKIQETGGDSSVLKVFRSNPVFFAIYGLVFLMVVLLYAIIVFLPQLLEKIGISSPFHISLFIATWSLAAGLASFMYGKIKSRLSYKTIVLIALVLLPVGFITISQTFSDWLIVVAVALVGIGMGMVMPAVVAWIDEIMPVSFRGRIVSYFGTFAFGGQFLSPIIFAPVVLLLGLSGVFMVAAIASALAFFLFLTALIPKSNRPS